MSVQFLQSTTPQENQTIRVNDHVPKEFQLVVVFL
jgi:hypothetical protein